MFVAVISHHGTARIKNTLKALCVLRFPEKNPLSWDSGNDIGLDGGGAIVPRMCVWLYNVANLRMMIKSVTNDTSSVCLLCFEHKSISEAVGVVSPRPNQT